MEILIVNGNAREMQSLTTCVSREGYVALQADGPEAGARVLQNQTPDVVLLELNGKSSKARELIEAASNLTPPPPVIVMADNARLEDAVQMMKSGAHDFWVKPVSAERLIKTLLLLATPNGTDSARVQRSAVQIITRDPAMANLKAVSQRVAPSNATVFIQGESGTGKEVFARYIHEQSDRRNRPFVAINCAALPETLLESELFGHEKGAFTGANKTRKGKFELAHTGTLLLDEVSEIPVHLQSKLLRVLQESEVDRLGGKHPVLVDVRVIATSNRNIKEAIEDGSFRTDLYYRLNVIPMRIPPLRERKSDISLLAEHFMAKHAARNTPNLPRLAPDALKALEGHNWPGNVRELENVIQRAMLLGGDEWITAEHLFLDADHTILSPAGDIELMTVEEMERRLIHKALEAQSGNRTRAAEILGISVRTLRNKLQAYRESGLLESAV